MQWRKSANGLESLGRDFPSGWEMGWASRACAWRADHSRILASCNQQIGALNKLHALPWLCLTWTTMLTSNKLIRRLESQFSRTGWEYLPQLQWLLDLLLPLPGSKGRELAYSKSSDFFRNRCFVLDLEDHRYPGLDRWRDSSLGGNRT